MIPGKTQDTGIFDVREDDPRFSIQATVDDLFHDRPEVGSFPRSQHPQPERLVHLR
jgi:hypothetical protein